MKSKLRPGLPLSKPYFTLSTFLNTNIRFDHIRRTGEEETMDDAAEKGLHDPSLSKSHSPFASSSSSSSSSSSHTSPFNSLLSSPKTKSKTGLLKSDLERSSSSTTSYARLSPATTRRLTWLFLLASIVYSLFILADIHLAHSTPSPLPGNGSRNCFAVLLAANSGTKDQDDLAVDHYFRALRVLHFQFKHANETRYSDRSTPFVVLHTPQVGKKKLEVLKKEGATLIAVDNVDPGWAINNDQKNWAQMFSKLEAWRLTQFDRIMLVDADHLLLKSFDGIFDDPALKRQDMIVDKLNDLEASLDPRPFNYVMAGYQDRGMDINHYMNGGFLIFSPSMNMYNYLRAFLAAPNSFSSGFQEQAMLNTIHRGDGPMPWKQINKKWNTNYAMVEDAERGIVSVHGRWWETGEIGKVDMEDGDKRFAHDPDLSTRWWRVYGQMEAFYKDVTLV